jgi:hypothetical protein
VIRSPSPRRVAELSRIWIKPSPAWRWPLSFPSRCYRWTLGRSTEPHTGGQKKKQAPTPGAAAGLRPPRRRSEENGQASCTAHPPSAAQYTRASCAIPVDASSSSPRHVTAAVLPPLPMGSSRPPPRDMSLGGAYGRVEIPRTIRVGARREGATVLAGLRSGDGPRSVRARPSSIKRDCGRRTTSTGKGAWQTYTQSRA